MLFKRLKLNKLAVVISLITISIFFVLTPKTEAISSLSGRILLQVQDKGQAWYVNPVNNKRYYLGRPEDAYALMRSLGLGVSNSDFNLFLKKVPARLAGRIILKVQDKGQAYYVDPLELKLYYLGRASDAFSVMRARGLGISNRDLANIAIATIPVSPSPVATSGHFTFKYQNNNYEFTQPLSSALYGYYSNLPKVYTYTVGNEPANLREVFYGLFLKLKAGDTTIDEIITKLKAAASSKGWSDDKTLEFIFSFVQYIPYDHAKVAADPGVNSNPYFPYETIYLNKGVCSDKTFLAVVLLRKLGYGAAILDFPDRNHTALGVACPKEYSINNSGYCYGETTNYFPLGVIPQSISNGQAQTAEEFSGLFNPSSLGKIEIYQATQGKLYQGMPALIAQVEALKTAKADIGTRQTEINTLAANLSSREASVNNLKSRMENYLSSGQTAEYNNLVPSYNALVNQYNADLAAYQVKINEYNAKVSEFNASVRLFYQE
jgi:hypothetical protein